MTSLQTGGRRTRARIPTCRRQAGYSLIEMAVVLGLFAAVLALGAAIAHRLLSSDDLPDAMDVAVYVDAVKRYALRERRLPCPDPVGNGYEGGGSACPADLQVGGLPWITLGLDEPVVPVGRKLTYAVWRQAGTDLVNPSWPDEGREDEVAVKRMLSTVSRAAAVQGVNGVVSDQPNVQPPSIVDRPVCVTPRRNPAFVVSFEDPTFAAENSKCLAGGRERALMAIGRFELTGWWLRTAGQGFARY